METILAIIIICFILYMNYSNTIKQPLYLNMNIREMCQKADNTIDEDTKKSIEKMQKEYAKNLDECKTKVSAEKKRANDLFLKYGDTEPNNIDFLYYGNSDYPLSGDDKLAYRMYDLGQKNKQAITNRALWNKNSLLPYIEQELRDHSNSIWWDDETLEQEF